MRKQILRVIVMMLVTFLVASVLVYYVFILEGAECKTCDGNGSNGDGLTGNEQFVFETANGEPHPEFVLDNLTKGPVFLEYRQDCDSSCDIMESIIQKIFNIQFGHSDIFYETIDYNGTNLTFIHIPLDHASAELVESYFIYDKDSQSGVPMHVVITWEYNKGEIQPCYQTGYAFLREETDEERESALRDMVTQAIELYILNDIAE